MKAKNLSLLILLISQINLVAQSPWVKSKAKGYSHVSFGIIPGYNQIFEGNRNQITDLDRTITEYSLQSYSEVGLGKSWEIELNLPLRYITQSNDLINDNILGLGNIEVGLKKGLINKKYALATTAQIGLPTGNTNSSIGFRTGYETTYGTLLMSLGRGFNKSYFYAYGGFALFGNNYSNDFRFGGEYGWHIKKRFWAILGFASRNTLKKTVVENDNNYDRTHLYVSNQAFQSLFMKAIFEVSAKSGINFSMNLITLWANKLPFMRPYAIGYYLKW